MVVKGALFVPAASTNGIWASTAEKLLGSKMLLYQLAPGLNWFPRFGLNRCVKPATRVRCGCGEYELEMRFTGSVYAACKPVSCWNRYQTLLLASMEWSILSTIRSSLSLLFSDSWSWLAQPLPSMRFPLLSAPGIGAPIASSGHVLMA